MTKGLVRPRGRTAKATFHKQNGDLTAYAFLCGHIQTAKVGPFMTSLEHNAGVGYDVKLTREGSGLLVWETYDGVNKARAAYQKLLRACEDYNRARKRMDAAIAKMQRSKVSCRVAYEFTLRGK